MPQTRTLFMTTLVLAVMSLFLAIVLTGCVLCLILLPAYRLSHRFVLAESGINKSKWKWTFGLAVLLCFVALLLSFTLFVQLPDCLAKDSPDHSCSSNECGSFIGGQRQKGGYLHIYTPFVGWGSAVASCIFVAIVGTLFLALFGRKRNARAPGLALATINATEHSRREATPDPADDDAGERRPLLAGEKAERARRADSPGSPSRDNGGLHHRTTSSAKTSPKDKAEDATIDDCDSPLAYHKPCPSSPSLARMQPLITLTSPRHTPSPLANLDSRFAAAAALPTATPTFADTKGETPLLEEHGEAEAERNGGTQGSEGAREANISSTSTTHGDADTASGEGASEEAKETKGEGERTEDTTKDDKRREVSAAEATVEDAIEEKESGEAEPQAVEGAGGETHGETMKEEKAEQKEKAEGEQEEDPTPKPVARRAFATMQRMSYKDYAKKKAAPPTPESVLGPSRVRGVPTNRMALRSRGAPLSSVKDQALATSPSRSATMPAATRRLPTTAARPRAVLASEDTERPTTQPEPEEREKEKETEETKESEKVDKKEENEEEESKPAGEQTNSSDDTTHSVAATSSTTTVTDSNTTEEDDDRSDSAS